MSNFPAPWRQYSSIAGPDGQVYYYLFRSWRGEQTAALGRLEGHLPLREKIIILGTVTSDSLVNNPQSYCLIPQATAPTIGTRDKFGLLAIHDQGFVIGYAAGNKASFGYELAHGLFLNPDALSALDWK
ncbi:hypothetical protein QPK87_11185 [Kamptonema cortianum]|nr:hypothetical protein [Kamptonema cortianum]